MVKMDSDGERIRIVLMGDNKVMIFFTNDENIIFFQNGPHVLYAEIQINLFLERETQHSIFSAEKFEILTSGFFK